MANVYSYFERACRREPKPFGDTPGDRIQEEDGTAAQFWVRLSNGRITDVRYKCTACCTLVALCERLAEIMTGSTPEQVLLFDANRLLELHPEIPSERRNRAGLAVNAAYSAVQQKLEGAHW